MIKIIQVVAAVIEKGDFVLISSRPANKKGAGLWEFPGGKIEHGETVANAVRRELAEELGLTSVTVLDTIFCCTHSYPDSTVNVRFIRCRIPQNAIITSLEGQQFKWVERKNLPIDQLLPADKPLAKWLNF